MPRKLKGKSLFVSAFLSGPAADTLIYQDLHVPYVQNSNIRTSVVASLGIFSHSQSQSSSQNSKILDQET